jgi:gliding motility-associated-like protein
LSGASQSSLSAGTYTATVTDAGGCSSSISVTIAEPSAITIIQGTITPANCGVSDGAASVSASGGTGTLSYAWSPSGGTSSTVSNIPGGTYTVTVTDQNACTSTLGVSSQTNVSCNGGSDGAATVSATGGTSPYTYAWTPTGGTSSTASGLAAGTYTVAVTDASSCIGSASVTITEPLALSVTNVLTPADCGSTNGSIALTATGGTAPYTYSWSPSVGSGATASNLAPGSYTATITDASGCTTTNTGTILTTGSLTVTATPDLTTINQGDTVALTVTGANSYTWTPASGLSCTDCPNPNASPSQSAIYTVTGTDATGCTGTATVTIIVIENCGELYVPTVFAPSGSSNNPENQHLCVYGNCISSLSYTIFDRWGNKVFETTATDLCWDGTFKGKELNAGVFAYKLIVTLHNGDYIEESGNVTLIR